MVFSRFFNNANQVEAVSYFYPTGVKNSTAVLMDIDKSIKIYDDKNGEALQVTFAIPEKYRSKIISISEVVFTVH